MPTNSSEYTETKAYERGFADYYAAKILPEVKDLENERLKTKQQFFLIYLPLGLIVMAVALYLITLYENSDVIIWLWFGLLFVGLGITLIPFVLFEDSYQDKIIKKAVAFFKDVHFEHDDVFQQSDFDSLKIFPNCKLRSSSPALVGEYHQIKFCYAVTDLDINGQNDVFSGNILQITLNQHFQHDIYFCHGLSHSTLLNFIAGEDKLTQDERIYLEDKAFNEKFTVLCKDQIYARRIITPHFMEVLYQLDSSIVKKRFKAKVYPRLSFQENKITLGFNNAANPFCGGNFLVTQNYQENIKKTLHNIAVVYNLIDVLKDNLKGRNL